MIFENIFRKEKGESIEEKIKDLIEPIRRDYQSKEIYVKILKHKFYEDIYPEGKYSFIENCIIYPKRTFYGVEAEIKTPIFIEEYNYYIPHSLETKTIFKERIPDDCYLPLREGQNLLKKCTKVSDIIQKSLERSNIYSIIDEATYGVINPLNKRFLSTNSDLINFIAGNFSSEEIKKINSTIRCGKREENYFIDLLLNLATYRDKYGDYYHSKEFSIPLDRFGLSLFFLPFNENYLMNKRDKICETVINTLGKFGIKTHIDYFGGIVF